MSPSARSVRFTVDETVFGELEKIAARELRTIAEVARLLISTGLRTYRRKSSLRCGFEGCTRKGCCGKPGVVVPFRLERREQALFPAELDVKAILEAASKIKPEHGDGLEVGSYMILDTGGAIVAWSAELERLLGVPRDRALGRPWGELFPLGRYSGGNDRFSRVLAGETFTTSSIPCLRTDGRIVLVDGMISPVRDTVGNVVAVSSVMRPRCRPVAVASAAG